MLLSTVHVHVLLCSSTNLTELAKAARILATLNPNDLEGDDLLKAARALAAATAALLNAAAPENIEVGFNWNTTCNYMVEVYTIVFC